MNVRQFAQGFLFLLMLLAAAAQQGCATVTPKDEVGPLMAEGQQLFNAKNFDAALEKFRAVAKLNPGHWPAHYWIARAQAARGAWGESIQAAKRALELAPDNGDVLKILGESLFSAGTAALEAKRYQEAVDHFGQYLKLQPGNAKAWLNVAKAYLGQKRFQDALQALLTALGSDGSDRGEVVRALVDAGRQALAERDFRNAAGFLREYVKHDSNLRGWLDLARAYWEEGERSDALQAVRRALEISPGNAEALRFLRPR